MSIDSRKMSCNSISVPNREPHLLYVQVAGRDFGTPVPAKQFIIKKEAYFGYHKVAGNDQGS